MNHVLQTLVYGGGSLLDQLEAVLNSEVFLPEVVWELMWLAQLLDVFWIFPAGRSQAIFSEEDGVCPGVHTAYSQLQIFEEKASKHQVTHRKRRGVHLEKDPPQRVIA